MTKEGKIQTKFREELSALINKFSLENNSDTPDFILAAYLSDCLTAFDTATGLRESWYGRPIDPSRI